MPIINLLEKNQRSGIEVETWPVEQICGFTMLNGVIQLSVPVLMALADHYNVDWRDVVMDKSANILADLRNAIQEWPYDIVCF